MKKLLLFFISLILGSAVTAADLSAFSWRSINGKWIIDSQQKILCDTTTKSHQYHLSELIDNNSITTNSPLANANKIETTFYITDPNELSRFFLFFSGNSYRDFYGIELKGSIEKINTLSVIKSSIKDTTLSNSTKNNFQIDTLSTQPIDLQYNTDIKLRLEIKNKKCTVFINNKKALSFEGDRSLENGILGFSHRMNLLSVSSIKVWSGKKIIFEDTFEKDSIKRIVVQATSVK